jgi:hypothetical protein
MAPQEAHPELMNRLMNAADVHAEKDAEPDVPFLSDETKTILAALLAEFIGTMFLVLISVGIQVSPLPCICLLPHPPCALVVRMEFARLALSFAPTLFPVCTMLFATSRLRLLQTVISGPACRVALSICAFVRAGVLSGSSLPPSSNEQTSF